MLGGWTLLGDTCPHDACIGSPLMRKKLGYNSHKTLYARLMLR